MAYMPRRDEHSTLYCKRESKAPLSLHHLEQGPRLRENALLSPFSLHFMGVETEKINPSNIENYEQYHR